MSTTSRSQSSSPDILGPPGDADYLISSPIKPFTGRQSWLSPATVKRHRTPAKRRRATLSPTKSAHSIRFDDVLLPGSPTSKLDGRQRVFSPERLTQDGNVSPWRIRVTLEATQDEENRGSMSPSRKRLKASTVTTKVPLKDDGSPLKQKTPAKRRGRPPKSDPQLQQNGSPWPGSPGNTPGPAGATPKRRPGRPRKGTPKTQTQVTSMLADEPADGPTPTTESAQQHFSPMDITADGSTNPDRPWSPMNLVGDGGGFGSDSPRADDFAVSNFPASTIAPVQPREDNASRDYGRMNYDTPVIGATEHHFLDNDENIHSTPSKMPSPTRERLGSSASSSRRAGSITSHRTYPTPTPTSSLADEENHHREQAAEAHDRSQQATTDHGDVAERLVDPTDEHEEFDSIMESEGFTMVSLDTLPSAKQYVLGASARANSNESTKERDSARIGDRLRRKLPETIDNLRGETQNSTRSSPKTQARSSKSPTLGRTDIEPGLLEMQGFVQRSYSDHPGMHSPERQATEADENEDQVHMADDNERYNSPAGPQTRNALIENVENSEEQEGEEEDEPMVVSAEPRLSFPSQHQMGDPGRSQQEEKWQREREIVSRHAMDPINSAKLIYIESDEDVPQENHENASADHFQTEAESVVDEEPLAEELLHEQVSGDESLDEEVENYEPEIVSVSRPASRQKTRLTEDPINEDDDDGSEDIWRQDTFDREPEIVPGLRSPHVHDMEAEHQAVDDDDGEDIWQQEARDQSHVSQLSDSRDRRDTGHDHHSSPWRQNESLSTNKDRMSSSPAYVTVEHRDGLHQVPTHIRKLRDQNVDLSAILAQEETPNRARYYNGTSTPRDVSSRRPGASLPSAMKSASSTRKTGQRVRLQPISQSSPEMGSEAEFSYSPAFKPNTSRQRPIQEEAENYSENGHESESGYTEAPAATPKPPRHSDQDVPGSTWFQRITSLTPRWLKAPNRDDDDSSSLAAASEDDYEDDDDMENEAEVGSAKSIDARAMVDKYAIASGLSTEPSSRFMEKSASPSQSDGPDSVPSDKEKDEPDSEQVNIGDVQRDTFDAHAGAGNAKEFPMEDDLGEAGLLRMIKGDHTKSTRPRPLSSFGYFSDEHYKALRRIYRMAKRHPERFLYHDAPGRAEIIGDWIWTSDGHHGVPITEVQFAIIDRFAQDLSRADIDYGGSGQVEWTEAELHRRLISIIIGEQIRESQKAKSAREVSVDTWL